MALKYLVDIDLGRNYLKNVAIESLASAPGTPVAGMVYQNSTNNTVEMYINGGWVDITGKVISITSGTTALTVDNTDPANPELSIADATGSNSGLMSATHYTDVNTATDANTASKIVKRDGSGDFSANLITISGTPTASNHVINKGYVDAAISGLDFQTDVLNKQTDATLDPGASPTTGDRYIIAASASLHANFGTITGVGDGDIVEYDGADFVVAYDVSVAGEGALAWNQNDNYFERYDGSSWSEFGGLSGVTAGNGLTKTGNTLNIGAGTGITVNADDIAITAGGVDTTQLADDGVTAAKLNADTAGAGLVPNGTTGALDVNTGNGIQIDTDAVALGALTANWDLSGGSFTIQTIDPTADTHVATQGWVNSQISGSSINTYTALIGNNTNTTLTVNHALGNQYVNVTLYEASSGDMVSAEVSLTDANNLDVTFTTAPATNAYRIVVAG